MAQTLCIKCGSELKASSYCQLCQQPLIFACTSCEYITEEKVHTDCRNAEILAKTATTTQEDTTIAAPNTATTLGPASTTGNQQQSIVNKPKVGEAKQGSASYYMTKQQDN